MDRRKGRCFFALTFLVASIHKTLATGIIYNEKSNPIMAVSRVSGSVKNPRLLSVTYYDSASGRKTCERQLILPAKAQAVFHNPVTGKYMLELDCTKTNTPTVPLHEANFTKRPAEVFPQRQFSQTTCKGDIRVLF